MTSKTAISDYKSLALSIGLRDSMSVGFVISRCNVYCKKYQMNVVKKHKTVLRCIGTKLTDLSFWIKFALNNTEIA